MRRTLARIFLVSVVLVGAAFVSGSPANAQSSGGGCPAGFAPIVVESGKSLAAVAPGVPATCINTACPSSMVALSPYLDGSSPKLAGSATSGASSILGCTARASEVAPVVVQGETETLPITVVGGVVQTADPAVSGGIRASVLARTGADSGSQLRYSVLLVAAGLGLTAVSMLRRRALRRAAVVTA